MVRPCTYDPRVTQKDVCEPPFYIELQTQNFSMFRFSDILSFNMTFSVDPDDVLPKGKGDVPSMVVAWTHSSRIVPMQIHNAWHAWLDGLGGGLVVVIGINT